MMESLTFLILYYEIFIIYLFTINFLVNIKSMIACYYNFYYKYPYVPCMLEQDTTY